MADGYFIDAKDWRDFCQMLKAFRANGKVIGNSSGTGQSRATGERFEFAKLDDAVVEGTNTDKTMTLWRGPAFGGMDNSLSITVPVDWAAEDMDADTYVTASKKRGKWYAFRLLCEEA